MKDGIVTCSNLINQPIKSLRAIYPEMLSAKDTLVLRAARLLNRGSPILLFWRPDQASPTSGMVYIFNIATLSAFILAPRPPYVDYMALNVAGHTLRFNDTRIRTPTDAADAETPPRLELHSSRYPFSISLFSPAARDLALQRLPRHIPLALLLFLLASILTYLASANRMSLAYPIAQAIRRRQFQLYCQPIIHTESGRCEGWRSCCAGIIRAMAGPRRRSSFPGRAEWAYRSADSLPAGNAGGAAPPFSKRSRFLLQY
ncbi:hypothetical protein O0544_21070 [Edwardsiella anguillarum]|nr:hypothetical protein [Edwardsiella anguillarum]